MTARAQRRDLMYMGSPGRRGGDNQETQEHHFFPSFSNITLIMRIPPFVQPVFLYFNPKILFSLKNETIIDRWQLVGNIEDNFILQEKKSLHNRTRKK